MIRQLVRRARAISASCAVILAVATGHAAEKGDAETTKPLGLYTVTAAEENGKEQPKERVNNVKVQFTADEIITTDKDDKRIYVASYKLDTSTKPWKISMKSVVPKEGMQADGLLSMEGETIRLIYSLPGGKTPTEFKTGEQQNMFTMSLVKQ